MKIFKLVLLIIVFLLVVTAVIFSQINTKVGKFDLSKFSSSDLYRAGQQKAKIGDFKEAKKYIEAALDKAPGNVTYLGELAVIKYKMGDYNGAIEEYEKIYQAGEAKGFAMNGIGNTYRDQKKYPQAKKAYEQGINDDSQYIALYQNYALMLVGQNQLENAKIVLRRGIDKTSSKELEGTLNNIQ